METWKSFGGCYKPNPHVPQNSHSWMKVSRKTHTQTVKYSALNRKTIQTHAQHERTMKTLCQVKQASNKVKGQSSSITWVVGDCGERRLRALSPSGRKYYSPFTRRLPRVWEIGAGVGNIKSVPWLSTNLSFNHRENKERQIFPPIWWPGPSLRNI